MTNKIFQTTYLPNFSIKSRISFFLYGCYSYIVDIKQRDMKKLTILLALLLPVISFAQLDFTVRYVKHIKGYPVYEVRYHGHFLDMNKTRISKGSDPLVETNKLKKIALERGIFAFEHFDYFNNAMDTTISHHEGMLCSENYNSEFEGAGISPAKLSSVDLDFVKSRINSNYRTYTNNKQTPLLETGYDYNNSPGHFSNRINKGHTTYGDCFLVTFIPMANKDYNPRGEGLQRKTIPTMVAIHYELFQ